MQDLVADVKCVVLLIHDSKIVTLYWCFIDALSLGPTIFDWDHQNWR